MGGNGLCYRVFTLGGLYRTDQSKDRVYWLIVIMFKLILPSLFVVVSQRSELDAYNWQMEVHYKTNMRGRCHAYKLVPSIGYTPSDRFNVIDEYYDDTGTSEGAQGSKTPDISVKELDKQLKEIADLTNKGLVFLNQGKNSKRRVSEKCCKIFRQTVKEREICWKEEGGKVSASSFVLAMFIPLIATFLLSIIMVPIKNSKLLQRKMVGRGNRPSMEVTAEETIRTIQNSVQFVIELAAFYCMVYKIWELSDSVLKCAGYAPCLPTYKSHQLIFLVVVAQTPWITILWSLI
uniref:uncharacterized protein LOC104265875 n=1 Tax=Ciona intestinalis TaxID=7719 RepID=UPI0005216B63|nr:uncharacterized protein LOC104265875 [Ciona intestinalis]|eukprot:XP_009859214.1 uncharacterized protein LOC104265875 [Ciona intestinalis]